MPPPPLSSVITHLSARWSACQLQSLCQASPLLSHGPHGPLGAHAGPPLRPWSPGWPQAPQFPADPPCLQLNPPAIPSAVVLSVRAESVVPRLFYLVLRALGRGRSGTPGTAARAPHPQHFRTHKCQQADDGRRCEGSHNSATGATMQVEAGPA